MDDADQINHQKNLSPPSIYAAIRAAINLVNKLDTTILFRLAIVITNLNNTKHINIVDIPPQNTKPRVMPPLPLTTQPTLPNKLSLQRTSLPERNIRVTLGNQTQSQYFSERSLQNPFRCIQLAPHIFSGVIMGMQI